jgi:hypothetical protein
VLSCAGQHNLTEVGHEDACSNVTCSPGCAERLPLPVRADPDRITQVLDNLAHPVAAMLHGNSVAAYLPSGLSEPGGAGLGTLGLPPSRQERMCRRAGFLRFLVHDVGDPANLY